MSSVSLRILFLGVVLSLRCLPTVLAQETDLSKGGWDEIPEEEFESQSPRVQDDAHSEFTYREIRIDDTQDFSTTHRYHYRVKLFSEAAVSDWDKIDIEYVEGMRVTNIKARVIYPDRTAVQLKGSDIVKRKIFKNDSFSGYAKSFSFPGLKPGCIIEYSWKLSIDTWFKGVTLDLLSEYPTWKYDVEVKPYKGLASSVRSYNIGVDWEKAGRGYRVGLTDLPAESELPYVGPRRDFEPFVVVEYSGEIKALKQEKYWNYRAGRLGNVNDELVKPKSGRVKKLAEELFAGMSLNEEKIAVAYDYCVNSIVNISEPTDVYTEEEIEDLKRNDNPASTLKNGYGTKLDINALFASLVGAAGFEVSLAEVEDRTSCTYHKNLLGGFNLSDWAVAVKVNNKYKYFDPGSSFLPLGTLNARNAGAHAILIEGKFFYEKETPDVPDNYSRTSRLAEVTLNEYGDLEGEVTIAYDGYAGISQKRTFADMTNKECEDFITEKIWTPRLPRAEIKDYSSKNENERGKPIVVSYKVKIPGYATVGGERMIFNPSIFQEGAKPIFVEEKRDVPIGFPYRPYVIDKVVFTLPEGFAYESSAGVDSDEAGNLIVRKSTAGVEEDGTFVYQRLYTLKTDRVNSRFYDLVKNEFGFVNESDHRPVTFIWSAE